jgi:2-dehydro-3-deoxyphosphogluconate aldolase / (4S)-4-hydroxy-2-oxoglutarate aldolase
MPRTEPDAIVERLAELVLCPVIEIPEAASAAPLADALVQAGLPCAEITFRTPSAAAAIASIAGRSDLLVGAGTILSSEDVDRALEAGARFLVSPGFNPDVVEHALGRGATMIPGVCTPTEVEMALRHGIDVVKFFPAEAAGGAAYVKALAAPYRRVRFVPTGGIDAAKLEAYLALPAVIAIGGSWMAPRNLIADGDFGAIGERTREAVDLVRRLRPAPAGVAG